jgi:prepilin-type N-terminal cleavage/methylation domain-containing protein
MFPKKPMNPVIKPITSKNGFTLTELLVVIVIVAALAAIAFTQALRMKKSANQAITTANLRQIGVALITYTADNRMTNAEFVTKYWPGTIGNLN